MLDITSTQEYTCDMIPPHTESGVLPPGEHVATWEEIVERFGGNEKRERLLTGLKVAIANLGDAGCRRVWVDGSFITDKEEPGDYDLCWDTSEVDYDKLDPVITKVRFPRHEQLARFYGEILPAGGFAGVDSEGRRMTFPAYFQQDDRIGCAAKGIIVLQKKHFPSV